LIRI
jgi:hypothetical protein